MNNEILPRWGLQEVNFVETDADKVKAEVLSVYESETGRTLATADPRRLDLLSMAALFIQERVCANTAAQQTLLTYAQGLYLDALGEFVSVKRKPACGAVTTLRFRLSQALANAYSIPAGFEVTTGELVFTTDEELVIAPGELTGDVSATCKIYGAEGNSYLPGQITTIVTPMAFLASVTNTTTTSGGADTESDADFAERIRLAPNSFSVAGPKKAYIYHAKSVSPAIIDVEVASPDPGEVHVYPLLEGGELPSETILEQIGDCLSSDSIRPLTDHVSVLQPVSVNYQINVDYWVLESDKGKAETIRANVEQAVEEYRLWQQSKIGRDITPMQLIQKVAAAGASRIDGNTMLPNAFVKLDENEVAQCAKTNVTVTYKGYKEE